MISKYKTIHTLLTNVHLDCRGWEVGGEGWGGEGWWGGVGGGVGGEGGGGGGQ